MFEVFGDCPNTGKGVQETVNTKYGRLVFGEKERATLKQRSPFVRGVRDCLNTAKGVQGTVNNKYGRLVFGEKKRPTLKQRSAYVGGVWRQPKHSNRCSRNCEHQVWAFSVRGKNKSHFETEVTFCSRCSDTA